MSEKKPFRLEDVLFINKNLLLLFRYRDTAQITVRFGFTV